MMTTIRVRERIVAGAFDGLEKLRQLMYGRVLEHDDGRQAS